MSLSQKDKIYFSPYELETWSGLKKHGAFIKIHFAKHDHKIGYADCFTWPELGDLVLEKQLESFKTGSLTSITRQTRYFAELDATLDPVKRWSGLEIPQSHFLVAELSKYANKVPHLLNAMGDTSIVKIKVAKNVDLEKTFLNSLAETFKGTDKKIRLDFNESLNAKEVEMFFSKASTELLQRIDFLEDPCPWSALTWTHLAKTLGLRLALDRHAEDYIDLGPTQDEGPDIDLAFHVLIVKPAKNDFIKMASWAALNMKRVVVTSYMDSPVGQMCATYAAAQVQALHPLLVDTCGLRSELVYKNNYLWDQRNMSEKAWGFADHMDSLNWQEL